MNRARHLVDRYRVLPVQIKASTWFLICAIFQRGISAITTPLFTRIMTTDEYGNYGVFMSWTSIVTCFVTLNVYGGIYTQGLVKHQLDRERFAAAYQGLLFTLSILWLVVYVVFQKRINNLLSINTKQGVLMLIYVWNYGVCQLWSQKQRVNFRYRAIVATTIVYAIISSVLGVILVVLSAEKVTARIVGITLAATIAYSWMCIHDIVAGKVFYWGSVWKHAISLSIPLLPHYLSQIVLNTSDRIMISKIVGESEAGIYSLAYTLSFLMTLFNTSLLSTIEPWIYSKIRDRKTDELKRVAYPVLLFIAGVNIMLISVAPEIVKVFAPSEYYEAIWIIPPVTMSVFFMFSYSLFAEFAFFY